MDLRQLCPTKPERVKQESVLAQLTHEAGQRQEEWKRRTDQPGELYECLPADLHRRINEELKKEHGLALKKWFTSQKIDVIKSVPGDPHLLKNGSVSTSSQRFALLIPFPPLDLLKVQYLPDKEDPSTQRPIDLLGPTLLPSNSALIVEAGEMKFQMIVFECRAMRAQDSDAEADG
ncbi:hypothetical protein B0T25DRAFT_561467 [Lasiosphaeria hispida]|uniref:Uncharacterized protein n=1 Tax=Lasiosphaeria hispida TaxID=260671 RepID=A0AAJ0HTI5_9PEZI|nr:hypothetical protein B0T25DRAFT_561467 [Lasiosphaeria hispida]